MCNVWGGSKYQWSHFLELLRVNELEFSIWITHLLGPILGSFLQCLPFPRSPSHIYMLYSHTHTISFIS